MKQKSFLPKLYTSNIFKKLIILNIIIYMCIPILFQNNIFAAQVKSPYSEEKMKSYPGYVELIKKLQEKHPTWNFTILETGLDWNEVIKNETVALHGRNLVYYTYNGNWVCSTCGNTLYDTGKWKCASETAVAYYMDPRNWLNENNIFQFENLSYNEEVQNIEGVQKILNNVSWGKCETITYTKTDGTQGTINKSYAQVIMDAAKEAGISPYHLAARIKQEQGELSTSGTGCGNYEGYVGYYNLLNIKATGGNVIGNALKHAKSQGWDDPEKSIIGGAKFIATEYISRGQSTLYLQKFDVDNSEGSMYYHQYMQNVSAAYSEGNMVKTSYEAMGLLDSSLSFVIPVYENMPTEISQSPDAITLVTQNVKVKGTDVIIREGRTTSSKEIARVNKGDVLLRIEVTGIKEDGYYWDKIVLPDGTKGYVARDYIEQVADVTNADTLSVANTDVNLRNGPGTTGTRVISTLISGQALTVIETGKYNGLDGYDWLRVKLANGTQGYLASKYVTKATSSNYIFAYIDCTENGKVNVRSEIGTNSSVATSVGKDEKVTVLQKNAGSANGYNWDKIVTSNGIEGYIANIYLKYEVQETQPNAPQEPTTQKPPVINIGKNNNSYKTDGTYLICEPNTKVSDIKAAYGEAVVKSGDKVLENDALIGTGNVVSLDGKDYSVVKLGDINGDGLIKSADYILLKNYIAGKKQLTDSQKKAADINKDGNVKSADYILVKNFIAGKYKISI